MIEDVCPMLCIIAKTGMDPARVRLTNGARRYATATVFAGFVFVSGQKVSGVITTEVTGEICYPGE